MSDYSVLGTEDDNESMCSISEVQRNLFPEFDQEVQKDYLEVFLRIKPTTKDEQDDQARGIKTCYFYDFTEALQICHANISYLFSFF